MSIFTQPDWFLANVDLDKQVTSFIKTDKARLEYAAFHDGRTRLATESDTFVCSLDEALAWQQKRNEQSPIRVLAHMSFCGSTLLSRLLELDQRALVYREPRALADLASQRAAGHPFTSKEPGWRHLIEFAFRQYQKSHDERSVPVVKPSNWANNLLPDLIAQPMGVQVVLLDIGLRSYLLANLRGGRARLAYSLNLLNHLSARRVGYKQIIAEIEHASPSPMQRLLRALAVCHNIQMSIFEGVAKRLPEDHCLRLSKKEFLRAPEASLLRASTTLQLGRGGAPLSEAIASEMSRNAKVDGHEEYRLEQEVLQNNTLEAEIGADLDKAIEWHHGTFFPGIAV